MLGPERQIMMWRPSRPERPRLYTQHSGSQMPELFRGCSPLPSICENTVDLQALVKSVAKYVLVIVGPGAARWWQSSHTQGRAANVYVNAVCAFCNTFCLRGSCEHARVAFAELKHISLTQATLPARREAREPPEHMADVDIILLVRRLCRQPTPRRPCQ